MKRLLLVLLALSGCSDDAPKYTKKVISVHEMEKRKHPELSDTQLRHRRSAEMARYYGRERGNPNVNVKISQRVIEADTRVGQRMDSMHRLRERREAAMRARNLASREPRPQ